MLMLMMMVVSDDAYLEAKAPQTLPVPASHLVCTHVLVAQPALHTVCLSFLQEIGGASFDLQHVAVVNISLD